MPSGLGQSMSLSDKIVLPANPAYYQSVFKTVRNNATVEGTHQGGIDKASFQALQHFQFLAGIIVAIGFIDIENAGHVDALPLFFTHLAQFIVEGIGAEKKTGMEDIIMI